MAIFELAPAIRISTKIVKAQTSMLSVAVAEQPISVQFGRTQRVWLSFAMVILALFKRWRCRSVLTAALA